MTFDSYAALARRATHASARSRLAFHAEVHGQTHAQINERKRQSIGSPPPPSPRSRSEPAGFKAFGSSTGTKVTFTITPLVMGGSEGITLLFLSVAALVMGNLSIANSAAALRRV